MKALWDITNKEVVKKWKSGDTIWSVELGGLGPGYEQALQNFLFDLFAYLVKSKIPLKSLSNDKKYSKRYEDICDKIAKGRELTGAMVGSARATAYQFYKYGYAERMKTAPDDRMIQVENIKMINMGTNKNLNCKKCLSKLNLMGLKEK